MDELFKLIQLFVVKFPDSTEQEIHEINAFKKQILQLYLQVICYMTRTEICVLEWKSCDLGVRHFTAILLNTAIQLPHTSHVFIAFYFLSSNYKMLLHPESVLLTI